MKKRSSSDGEGGSKEGVGGGKYSIHSIQDNLHNLSHLQREHRQRLQAVETEFNQLNKFKDDYIHLQKRLKTLPDKTSHEVMVPLGPLAFMPGRLIHTNEILVLLGDNWFAERSAKEAIEIVKRRVIDCDEKIKSAETQMKIQQNWLKETSSLFEKGEEQVEIIEELTEEEYEISQEEHRQKVAEEFEKRRQLPILENPKDITATESDASVSGDNFIQKLDDTDKKAYESIMRRLEQLEVEEDEESIESQDIEEFDGEFIADVPEVLPTVADNEDNLLMGAVEDRPSAEFDVKQKRKLKRRVSWADDMKPLHTVIPDDNSKSTYRIKYTTKQLSLPCGAEWESAPLETPGENEDEDEAVSAVVQSPSDIYKVFSGRRSSLQDPHPRSILKKTISDPESQRGVDGGRNYLQKTSESLDSSPTDVIPSHPSFPSPSENKSLQSAFNYRVMERSVDHETAQSMPPSSSTDPQGKKISRFKAARMKK